MQGELLSIYRFLQGVALVAVASLALSVASGCGGGDSGATAESSSLSKAAFIAKADSLCKKAQAKLLKGYSHYMAKTNPSSAAEEKEAIAGFAEKVLQPDFGKLIEEIDQLGPPTGDTGQVSKFLDTFQSRLDEVASNPEELTKTATPFRAVSKLATTYGLKVCAQSING